MERKALVTEFKVNREKRVIEGYASTFGNRDHVNDVVVPGAYKNTIQGRVPKIKALRDHKHPIGKLSFAEEDSTGLFVRKDISDTPLGQETVTLVEDGVLDAMSIGYERIRSDYEMHGDGRKARMLKEIKLLEVSIVTWPANEAALITGVKSLADLDVLMTEIKAGAYTPEVAARLLHQAADKLLTLPADSPEPEQKDAPPETDPHTDLLAVQSLIREMNAHFRRAA